MRTVVVSLQRATERRKQMAAQLGRLGMDFEFFDAVDGRALTEEQVRDVYDEARARQTFWGPLNRGEIGCALSHITVWRRVVTDGAPYALILEDDAILDPATPQVVAALPPVLNRDDVVVLVKTNADTFFFRQSPLTGGRKLVYVNHPFYNATGYVITLGAAQRLLARARRIHVPIDFWYHDIGFKGATPIRAICPELVWQPLESDVPSQIGGRERHRGALSGTGKARSPLRAAVRAVRLKLKNRFLTWPVRF